MVLWMSLPLLQPFLPAALTLLPSCLKFLPTTTPTVHKISPPPPQLYDVLDMGQRALEVHGGPHCNLEQALDQLRLLRQQAAADEAERQARRASIAEESRQRAQRLAATTPAQRLCKQLGVAFDSKLTKTRAMELFALEACMLAGVPFESKVRGMSVNDASPGRLAYSTLELLELRLQSGRPVAGPPVPQVRPPSYPLVAAESPQPALRTHAAVRG